MEHITISEELFWELIEARGKIEAVRRYLSVNTYISETDIRALLDIKKEDAEKEGDANADN